MDCVREESRRRTSHILRFKLLSLARAVELKVSQ